MRKNITSHSAIILWTLAGLLYFDSAHVVHSSGPDSTEVRSHEATELSATQQPQDDEYWTPDSRALRGDWRSHRPPSHWQKMSPLQAPDGVTALAGQVLLLNGHPLADVTVQIGARTARTDNTGRFLLTELTAGHHVMILDGRTANKNKKQYCFFKIGVDVMGARTTALPFTIWMPRLETEHLSRFQSPTAQEVVVTTPHIPNLEVHVPAGSVVRDAEGQTVTQLSITPIPVDRTPFPLPQNVIVPVFFSVQPGASQVIPPRARVFYPNYTNERPGTRIDFWNYDPEDKGWYVYGQGSVTADGRQVIPDPGVVIYQFNGFMINRNSMPPPPPTGPEPSNNDKDGDPVDLSTGLFVYEKTDLVLSDTMPLILTRTYRPQDSASRPFGIGTTHPYELYLYSAQEYEEADLIKPDGGRVHYVRISPGTGYSDAEFEHSTSNSIYYKSRLRWNGNGWDLTLRNGLVYVFGDEAPLHTIKDGYGNQITISRAQSNGFGSPTGRITRLTSTNGRWIEFSYDASNRVTQARDNIARTVNYTYDEGGRLIRVTDPGGFSTEYTYDSVNRMLTVKDGRGIVFLTNQYDASGRVIKQTQADNTTFQFAYTLDSSNKIIRTDTTDPRGIVRRVQFNSSGEILSQTSALGKPEQQTITYERQPGTNLLLSVTGSLNRKTAYTYDAKGNITEVVNLSGTPEANSTRYTYDPTFNRPASLTDPLNRTSSYTYDGRGNLLTSTNPLSNTTNYTYDSGGWLVAMKDPSGNTGRVKYVGGEIVEMTDSQGNAIRRFTDDAGRLRSETNAQGQTTRYEYDPTGLLIRVRNSLGDTTTYTYDENGNVLSITDARGNTTTFTYDNMDRLTSRKDPLQRTESFAYDLAGNLTAYTDRRGLVTTFAYDSLNRQTFIGFGAASGQGSNESTITKTYDAAGRLIQMVDSVAGTVTFSYDKLDRLISKNTPQGAISYTYDAASQRTSMTVAGQPTVSYAYDAAGRLATITQGSANTSFGYDNANKRTSLTLPNGVTAEYGYDNKSLLSSITYRKGANQLGVLTYERDRNGNVVRMGGSLARTALPETMTSATHDAGNQLARAGAATLTHDANGNLTSDGSNSYTWNARNQLVSINGPGLSASFQYEGMGQRTSKTVNGRKTNYLYDGESVVQELSGTTPTANLLNGGLDQVLMRSDATGPKSFLTDRLNSTLALLDANGNIKTEYQYEPFGKKTISGTNSDNPVTFTAREDDETGFYYYRNRYYSPKLQRFISQDPLKFGGNDLNFYAYVNNNPVNTVDPYGLQGDPVGWQVEINYKGGKPTQLRRVGFDEAVELVKDYIDVQAKNSRTAREIAEAAGAGSPNWDTAHRGREAGHRPHYHPVDANGRRIGGHVFYGLDILNALGTLLNEHRAWRDLETRARKTGFSPEFQFFLESEAAGHPEFYSSPAGEMTPNPHFRPTYVPTML